MLKLDEIRQVWYWREIYMSKYLIFPAPRISESYIIKNFIKAFEAPQKNEKIKI